ncbi:hypothetical protein [Peribacillus kribbensis]|uniref:hypothetical protein n=1 Tax=Peribacillus kribbensis TaxID=356658 RepID=UPI0003FDC92B|nr:hypothetical protein [Peribacillus kribbensis]
MQINLEVTIFAHSTTFMKRGAFPVQPRAYKENPDLAAAETAYNWIQSIKMQTGYAPDTRIVKVIYNESHDITELVRTYKETGSLPF